MFAFIWFTLLTILLILKCICFHFHLFFDPYNLILVIREEVDWLPKKSTGGQDDKTVPLIFETYTPISKP